MLNVDTTNLAVSLANVIQPNNLVSTTGAPAPHCQVNRRPIGGPLPPAPTAPNWRLAVNGGSIYTSTDSGATWTERTSAGSRDWQSITSSSDGTKLAAAEYGGSIYTPTDSGATWTGALAPAAVTGGPLPPAQTAPNWL